MTWNKDPDKAFPARHPREPGGLRQDILDEIADHLACAAEREEERQESENEEVVWSRVLERFGNPDAIARKLWWDKMWEAVMREWIQTGVMVVVTIAVLAGLALMMRLVAGVGTANDAMREAMEQVAASNENLAKAMAEQRAGNEAMLKALSGIQSGGGEKPDALELSTIEIVVRRGTPEGPPAPEVKVQLDGQELSVTAEFDESGRAAFGPLIQGTYNFSFEDPRSRMAAYKTVTLFAGQGAGEYTIVAPEVIPRPVHLDFGLSAYAEDENQLISGRLHGYWEYEGLTWERKADVVVGHSGTRLAENLVGSSTRPRTTENRVGASTRPRTAEQEHAIRPTWSITSLEPCLLAGKISVTNLGVYFRDAYGDWSLSGYSGNVDTWNSEAEDGEGLHLTGALPSEVAAAYGEQARYFISAKEVPGEKNSPWLSASAALLADSAVMEVGSLSLLRAGEMRDGHVYAPKKNVFPRSIIASAHPSLGGARILAMMLPEGIALETFDEKELHLGLMVTQYEKRHVEDRGGIRLRTADDVFGNTISAYAIHGDWRSTDWPEWESNSPEPHTVLTTGEKPFWQVSSEGLKAMLHDGALLIPLSRELFTSQEQPVTGVLLRWEDSAEDFYWDVNIDLDGAATRYFPCWMVTEPIATAAEQRDGKALTDIDNGRFHYDSDAAIPEPLTPQEPIAQPAP